MTVCRQTLLGDSTSCNHCAGFNPGSTGKESDLTADCSLFSRKNRGLPLGLHSACCRVDANSSSATLRLHEAVVAELADAQDSGSCVRKDVEVRLLSTAVQKAACFQQVTSNAKHTLCLAFFRLRLPKWPVEQLVQRVARQVALTELMRDRQMCCTNQLFQEDYSPNSCG